MVYRYTPEVGDIVWLDFDAKIGHEQAGKSLTNANLGTCIRNSAAVARYQRQSHHGAVFYLSFGWYRPRDGFFKRVRNSPDAHLQIFILY